ncbi:amino acid kinase family protein [Roseimaritima sediminicola]|uniref:hypothetical protein n=1 Tax=Roseimaritima sediminicola TaxID=2662066 RepID=UPI0012985566|nr:hypothetical protein [Roseimaritima sediminicola]
MIRVIKLGGSLLLRRSLPSDFSSWLAGQAPAEANLLVVGGGEAIDSLRRLDSVHALDPVAMHWRCVRMLRSSFEVLGELLPEWQRIETAASFQRSSRDRAFAGNTLVAIDSFFTPASEAAEPEGGLAADWSTTSDAIAAVLARRVGAGELVLLKACRIEPEKTLAQHVRDGVVDPQFPRAARTIPSVRITMLKEPKEPKESISSNLSL